MDHESNGTVVLDAPQTERFVKHPKKVEMFMYFYRHESGFYDKSRDAYRYKNMTGTVYCSARPPKYDPSGGSNAFQNGAEVSICETGLAAWGLNRKDIPYDGVVRIRIERFETQLSKMVVKVEQTPFEDVKPEGPDRKTLARKARAALDEEEDDEDTDDEDEDEDEDN